MQITDKQFAEAIETFREGAAPRDATEKAIHNRIAAAATLVIRQRRGVSEEQPFSVTHGDVIDFLGGLDAEHAKKLKAIAEELTLDPVSPPSSQTRM
jgi:hypothetical protein